MSARQFKAEGQKRGTAVAAGRLTRSLLRVEGVTYTIDELARKVGQDPQAIRRRASKLIHRRQPLMLADFR